MEKRKKNRKKKHTHTHNPKGKEGQEDIRMSHYDKKYYKESINSTRFSYLNIKKKEFSHLNIKKELIVI